VAVRVLRTVAEARAFSKAARQGGRTLALVPTMGYLHEGHLSLMREARRRANTACATLFVNPTQFGPTEDLSRYPRDFEGDLRRCESVGLDALFAPEAEELYPAGHQTHVEVTKVSQGLDGQSRPGHFRGVATVVAKLFALFEPDLAFFGEKDFQQLQVIRALARDLCFGVQVVGMPTVREADGLAMSSRNSYLSPAARGQALALSRGLFAAQALARGGERRGEALVAAVRGQLAGAGIREDYVALVDAQTLAPIARLDDGVSARLLVAGFLGDVRLIDNVPLPG
jgi:pantoate--beta-alanine ligase